MQEQPTALRTYRVTVIEWLAHTTEIQAACQQEAQEAGRQLWLNGKHNDQFDLEDADIERVIADEVA